MTVPSHVRAALDSARRTIGVALLRNPGMVALVVLRGASMPDGVQFVPASGGCHVGVVTAERAKELARTRSDQAAGDLDRDPAPGNRWCIVLDGTRVALVPFTVPALGGAA